MIALDTNVIVRALTLDEPKQARRAAAILRSGPTFVAKTVLIEVEWVLRKAYRFAPAAVNEALRKLVGLATLEVEDRPAVIQALAWHAAGMDLADAMHLASSTTATEFASFDAELAKRARQSRAAPRIRLL